MNNINGAFIVCNGKEYPYRFVHVGDELVAVSTHELRKALYTADGTLKNNSRGIERFVDCYVPTRVLRTVSDKTLAKRAKELCHA